ncbi:MAG TPA: hypothetical protein PKE00_10510 [Planctomycetota bacterium]|nr:hypothetical protein [Planctomycetota bacterium]
MRLFSCVAIAALTTFSSPLQAQRRSATELWDFFAARHDKNNDGVISVDEYGRGEARFRDLDVDGDGKLTSKDFARTPARRRGAQRPQARLRGSQAPSATEQRPHWVRAFFAADEAGKSDGLSDGKSDGTADGIVKRAEWDAYCASKLNGGAIVVDGIGSMDIAEAKAVFARFDTDRNGELVGHELEVLSTRQAALAEGDVAPDFTLPYVGKVKASEGGKATLRLSSFRGKRPVALIFGSYT